MKYLYSGPLSGVTLQDGTEVLLRNGIEVELPEDNEYVKTLVAFSYLKPVTETVRNNKKSKTEIAEEAKDVPARY